MIRVKVILLLLQMVRMLHLLRIGEIRILLLRIGMYILKKELITGLMQVERYT